MGHTLNIYPEVNLVVVVFEGTIRIDELLETQEEISNHSEYMLSYHGIYDFRKAHKKLSPGDLDHLFANAIEPNPKKGRWCSLNSTPIETGLSELFKLRKIKAHPFEVFSTLEAASKYLHIDLSEFLD